MILLDTSALIDSLTGAGDSAAKFRQLLDSGERLIISSLVLFEWLRGPRREEELLAREQLFPDHVVVPFGVNEAVAAASLFREVSGARSRSLDLAVAATAIVRDAALWTLNRKDFDDIPRLRLI